MLEIRSVSKVAQSEISLVRNVNEPLELNMRRDVQMKSIVVERFALETVRYQCGLEFMIALFDSSETRARRVRRLPFFTARPLSSGMCSSDGSELQKNQLKTQTNKIQCVPAGVTLFHIGHRAIEESSLRERTSDESLHRRQQPNHIRLGRLRRHSHCAIDDFFGMNFVRFFFCVNSCGSLLVAIRLR